MTTARTFTVTITGHPARDVGDLITNLTFVYPGWDVTVTETTETDLLNNPPAARAVRLTTERPHGCRCSNGSAYPWPPY
jgi:hypothetical protein